MRARLALLLGAVIAVGSLGAPANASHEGIPGLRLRIEGDCFYHYVTQPPYQYAGLAAEVNAYENRDDVAQIRVRYLVQYRSTATADAWTTYQEWSHRKFTTNGETVRYDEGTASLYIAGEPNQVTDYRLIVTVTWVRPDGSYVHKFTAAQAIDGVCSDKTFPAAG